MKKSRFTESQILAILVEGGSGLPVAEVCRKHGISNATYYQWKSKYAGMSLPELKRVKELEAENARLKRMYAELALENTAIKDVLPSAVGEAIGSRGDVQEHRLSKAKARRIAGLSRAALYREPANRIERDAPVVSALNETVARHGRWGFWKCFQRLRDQGHEWNHKGVHRVYCSVRLNLPRRTKRHVITRERQPLVAPETVNQIWALDFMHDTLYDGHKFRLLNVIDEGNREALRIECGGSIPSSRLLRVLDELIDFYGKPQAIRMDNGPEVTSAKFVSWAEHHGIELRCIQPGKPNQIAFIERVNRSVRHEVLDAWLFDSLSQAQQILEGWRIEYNTVRSHESLDKKMPLAYLPRVVNTEIATFNSSA